MVDAFFEQVAAGNATALKQFLDRMDGPVKEEMEITSVSLTNEERADKILRILGRSAVRGARQGDSVLPS